jgi:YHS domain-containing protein
MKKTMHRITVSSVVGAALLCLLSRTSLLAQSYTIRPTCDPKGQCKINTATFGFNDTNWRTWPGQFRPEATDPKTIGGRRIPTPPPVIEQPLPSAENVPSKPPISEGTGPSILPPGVLPGTPGTTTTPNPNSPPANPSTEVPAPGKLTLPEFGPSAPDSTSKSGSGSLQLPSPTRPDTDLFQPLTPSPTTPAGDRPKTQEKENSAPKPSPFSPDLRPLLTPKSGEPSGAQPSKGSSLTPARRAPVASKVPGIQTELPIRANWSASLAADGIVDRQLHSTSYEQRLAPNNKPARAAQDDCNPLRSALAGYCPVELQEKGRWVAGNPELRTSYQGQVYLFSSDTTMRRFQAAPEKFAPMNGGNDIVLAIEENRTASGSVNHSAVWHDRLYLFASSSTLASFQEDPARYASQNHQKATSATGPGAR